MKTTVYYLIFLLGFSCSCLAKVDLKSTKPLVIPVDNVTPKLTSADIAQIVPLDLQQGSSQDTVLFRIVDRGITRLFNSAFVQQSSIGRIAQKTQEKLNTQVELGSGAPESIRHKISFKVEALQAMAKLEYTGWLNAAVNYDVKGSSTDILLNEKVLENKDLFVSYKVTGAQDVSMVGLAWSW